MNEEQAQVFGKFASVTKYHTHDMIFIGFIDTDYEPYEMHLANEQSLDDLIETLLKFKQALKGQ